MDQTTTLLTGISALAALGYGAILAGQEPSLHRTVVKTAAVGALAVLAFLSDAPWLLAAGLLLCAVGDAFLAGDPRRWLPLGLASFLVGHVLLIFLFHETRDPSREMTGLQLAGAIGVGLAAVVMLAWLWKALGPMRAAVILYVIVIAVMVGTSFLLPGFYWPAMLGAVAFMASDAILAGSLFREARLLGSRRLTGWAIWFLYYGAQALIAWAFLRPVF
ncbi:MAG: lysoplasmalogenase [Caulobacter sp.]|nr:lysoplasmalogenase [Caulobacter sp.]